MKGEGVNAGRIDWDTQRPFSSLAMLLLLDAW